MLHGALFWPNNIPLNVHATFFAAYIPYTDHNSAISGCTSICLSTCFPTSGHLLRSGLVDSKKISFFFLEKLPVLHNDFTFVYVQSNA